MRKMCQSTIIYYIYKQAKLFLRPIVLNMFQIPEFFQYILMGKPKSQPTYSKYFSTINPFYILNCANIWWRSNLWWAWKLLCSHTRKLIQKILKKILFNRANPCALIVQICQNIWPNVGNLSPLKALVHLLITDHLDQSNMVV